MRTFKPFCLSVMPRAVDLGSRFYLSLNVYAAFDVGATPRLLLEQSLWRFLPVAAPLFIEAGMPKPYSEYLVFGHAYPHGATKESTPGQGHVGIRFAGAQKALLVWGEREWDGRRVSAPAPYERVPLDWSLSYGGAGHSANPLGRGFPAEQASDKAPLPLPQLELPTSPWHPDPARNQSSGFGPLAVEHPLRTAYQGTYDEAWLKQLSPGMAKDFDWRFFQVAPPDQQLAKPLQGDESYEWHHLHPDLAVQTGQLPGVAPRAFIRRTGAQGLEPVATNLRTVLFFPEQQRVVLIWQGVAQTCDEEMSDISHLLVGAERLGEPKTPEHYQQVFSARDDREAGMLAVLREAELLPDGLDFEPLVSLEGRLNNDPPPASYAARARDAANRQFQKSRAEVAAYGLDPDEHAPPAEVPRPKVPTDVKDLPAFFESMRREHQEQVAQARTRLESSLQATEKALAPFGYDGQLVRSEIATPPSGPPKPEAPDRIAGMVKLAAMEAASGVAIGEVADMAVDKALHAEWHEGDRVAMEAYRTTVQHQKPATRALQRHAQRQQQWVRERLQAGQPLAGLDLTGADLRGFDFSGANLDKALMESALLDGVKFDGASLKDAVLAHASLQQASLLHCDLTRCNLGKAQLQGVHARGAQFEKANCYQADFSGAVLVEANFKQAQLVGVVLKGAKLVRATLDEAMLNETNLAGAHLAGASLRQTVFMKTCLDGADLQHVKAPRVVFYGVTMKQLRLDGAQLRGASFVEGSALNHCSLRGADLHSACARGTDFQGCDLSGAVLDGAMLAHADFTGATLRCASAVSAMLMHAVLDKADLRDMNLRDALLGSARARGANLSGANLFGSDLARIELDSRTVMDGVLAQRARLYPLARTAQEPASS